MKINNAKNNKLYVSQNKTYINDIINIGLGAYRQTPEVPAMKQTKCAVPNASLTMGRASKVL
jgi:hypothetical protein